MLILLFFVAPFSQTLAQPAQNIADTISKSGAQVKTTQPIQEEGLDSSFEKHHGGIITLHKDRSLTPGVFDMITNLPGDWRDWWLNTFTVDHLPAMALMAAATAALIVTDNPTWLPFKKAYETSTPVQRLSDAFVFMGDGKFQFGLAGAFGAYGLIAGDNRALRTCSQTAEVIVACGAVVQLLKHITGRESPIVTTSPTGVWRFFPNQVQYATHVPHYDAFPSGHIATATATLLVIANNYPEVKWIRPFGYVMLGGIATGLVCTSIHWWSDFPLGVALGYAFGTLVSPNPPEDFASTAIPIDPRTEAPQKLVKSFLVYPSFAFGGTGIGMSIGF
ncbi:MAG: phosphatase PAP2 family protein [Candidatus Kapaibacterium sp.]